MTTRVEEKSRVLQGPWKMLIGGRFVDASNAATFDSINPATEEAIAQVPSATEEDVDRAVTAAKEAFYRWRRLETRERAKYVFKIAERMRERMNDYALLEAYDVGSPVRSLRIDVQKGIDHLEYFAGIAMEIKGETIPASADHLHYTLREPYGVVARIIPFNHPLMFALQKVAAPLVAGNTMVIKPATFTPLTALELAKDLNEILPPGVVNIITGSGSRVGNALVMHKDVKRIALIGSTATGQAILKAAAETGIKHVSLELGGKNAMVVFPDYDPAKAAALAVKGMNFMQNQGQSCGSTSRVFAHKEIHQQFIRELVNRVEALKVGIPTREETEMGCVVSKQQYDTVMGYIQSGKEQGAEVASGGGRPKDPELSKGYFIAPTVFDNVKQPMRIAMEEIFGPVVSILEWSDYETMIQEVNAVQYGLTGAVLTNNLKLAHQCAADMETGYIWINDSARHFVGTSFGGYKHSGLGREESIHELMSYTQEKNVHVNLGD